MKNTVYIFVLVFGILLFSCENNLESPAHVNPDLKANSKVLVELFSNVMCVACVQSADYCDAVTSLKGVTINDTNVVVINVHTSLFPGDPFYSFNSGMNSAREDFYNVIFNPAGFLMGNMMTAPFSAEQWTNQINQKLSRKNRFSIIMSNTFDSVSGTGSLTMEAGILDGQSSGEIRLYIVVTESGLYFNSPNGKTNYNNILRQMINGYTGEIAVIEPGSPLTIVKQYALDRGISAGNARMTAFLQDSDTKDILGVESIKF